MAVTKYYKSFDGKTIEVKQAGEQLTFQEESVLRNKIGGDFTEVKEKVSVKNKPTKEVAPGLYTPAGKFRGADYKSGVDNNNFRIGFSNTNNFNEKVNYLDKKVGNEGYVVDKQGNFLLTPEGQAKLQGKTMFGFSGVSSGLGTGGEGNLLAIDSDKFEGEDFADLIGEVGLPALGSIAGEVLAYRNLGGKLPPQLRAITGMGLLLSVGGGAVGAYAGTLIDESQQWMRGISEEAKGDVQKRAAKEGLIGGAGAGVGYGFSKLIGSIIKGGPGINMTPSSALKAQQEDEATRNLMNVLLDAGLVYNPYAQRLLNKPNLERSTRIAEAIAGVSEKRILNNMEALKKHLTKVLGEETVKNTPDTIIEEMLKAAVKFRSGSLDDAVEMATKAAGKGLVAPLRSLQESVEKGDISIQGDGFKIYNDLQDATAVASTEAFDVAEKLSGNIFKNLDEISTEIVPAQPAKLGTRVSNAEKFPPEMAEELDALKQEGVAAKEIQDLKEKFRNFIQRDKLKDDGTWKAMYTEDYEQIANMRPTIPATPETTKSLWGTTSADEIGKKITEAEQTLASKGLSKEQRDVLKLNIDYLKGIQASAGGKPIKTLSNKEGIPQIAFVADEGQIKYVDPQELIEQVQLFKKRNGSNIDTGDGVFKKIYDLEEGQSILLSPTEMNSVIQEMRRLSINGDGIKFDPNSLWDAALNDLRVSNAQLTSAVKLAKEGGLKIPKGIDKKEFLSMMDDLDLYTKNVTEITKDNRIAAELFEQFDAAALATKYVRGKADANLDIVFGKTIGGGKNAPEILESFLDTIEKVSRRKDRGVYKQAQEAGIEINDMDVLSPRSRLAVDVLEQNKGTSKTADEMTGTDSSLAIQSERNARINQIDKLSSSELKDYVRRDLANMFIDYRLADASAEDIAKEIFQAAKVSPNSNGKSNLSLLFGDSGASELTDLALTISKAPSEVKKRLTANLGSTLTKAGDEGFDLSENLKTLQAEIQEASNFEAQEFVKKIRTKKFNIADKQDRTDLFENFANLQKNDLANIMSGVSKQDKKILQKELKQVLFRDLSESTMSDGGNVFFGGSGKTFDYQNINKVLDKYTPDQFNAVFGTSKYTNPYNALKSFNNKFELLEESQKGFVGGLIAAAVGAAIATAPAAVLTGSLSTGAALSLAATAVSARLVGEALLDPKVLRVIAEPKLPSGKYFRESNRTAAEKATKTGQTKEALRYINPYTYAGTASEGFDNYRILLQNTIVKSIQEQGDDIERSSSTRLQNLSFSDKSPELGIKKSFNEGLSSLTQGSPTVLQSASKGLQQLTGGTGYKNLPNVTRFNEDIDIFQEVDRRKALAGGNPDTQAIAERGQR